LRGQSAVEKTKRNREVLFPVHFTTLWKIEIHPKTDADALYRRWRRFLLRCKIHPLRRREKAIC